MPKSFWLALFQNFDGTSNFLTFASESGDDEKAKRNFKRTYKELFDDRYEGIPEVYEQTEVDGYKIELKEVPDA